MSDRAPGVTIVPVPNKPKTPISSFRIPTDLKKRVAVKAAANNTDLTAIIITALVKYDEENEEESE